MVGDLAAAIGLRHLGSHRGRVDQDVVGGAPQPEREDVRVLEQQQVVVAAAVAVEPALEDEGVPERHPTEPPHAQHRGGR